MLKKKKNEAQHICAPVVFLVATCPELTLKSHFPTEIPWHSWNWGKYKYIHIKVKIKFSPKITTYPIFFFIFLFFLFLFFLMRILNQMRMFDWLIDWLILAMLRLRFCARAFSSCGKRGPLFIAMRGPLSLRSTGSKRAGSAVVAHGPSRSAARGTLPGQGPNPCPLH